MSISGKMKDINLASNENIEKLSKAFRKAEETLKDQELLGRGLLIPIATVQKPATPLSGENPNAKRVNHMVRG